MHPSSLAQHPEGKPVVLLNAFDRSGSSAISRTLAKHPQIELIFQPFNSGSIRQKMYEILEPGNASVADKRFFQALEQGHLDESYIKSQWHYKYSTTRELQPGRLHLIKTTINHFTAEWQLQYFPKLGLWGIWRDPMAILKSLLENDFVEAWYRDGLQSILPSLEQRPYLAPYLDFVDQLDDAASLGAFLIAVRSHYFFQHLPASNILFYQDFVEQPNTALSKLTRSYGLADFDFEAASKEDWNVKGKAFHRKKAAQELPNKVKIEALFAPLRALIATK